jgi:hypothetical protein
MYTYICIHEYYIYIYIYIHICIHICIQTYTQILISTKPTRRKSTSEIPTPAETPKGRVIMYIYLCVRIYMYIAFPKTNRRKSTSEIPTPAETPNGTVLYCRSLRIYVFFPLFI